MAATETSSRLPSTRERLLEAAGRLFAQNGFAATGVREICERAGANLAAVNYHFGDKEALYTEVVVDVFRRAAERHPADGGLPPEADAEARLHAFVLAVLRRRLAADKPAWHARLIAREMADPGPALRSVVDQVLQNNFEYLQAVLRELLGARTDAETLRLAAASVVGQCLFYRTERQRTPAFHGEHLDDPERIEALATHITRFSLGGLRALLDVPGETDTSPPPPSTAVRGRGAHA